MESGRRRTTPWERLPTDPDDAVIWDREGDRFVGYLRPWHLAMVRAQVEFISALTQYRLAEHSVGGPLAPIDPRLDAVLELRRRTWAGERTELELLIPMANRYRRVLDLLPRGGTRLYLPDFTARHDLGVTALDLVQLLDRWLLALYTGETLHEPIGPSAVDDLASIRDWLTHQIVTQLMPDEGDPLPRYGIS